MRRQIDILYEIQRAVVLDRLIDLITFEAALLQVGRLHLLGLNHLMWVRDDQIWGTHGFSTLWAFLVELLGLFVDVDVRFGRVVECAHLLILK